MKDTKKIKWRRLDNASKIFPPTVTNRDTKVFRLYCELTEDVDPEILQEAISPTLDSFPMYRSILRRGAFWYYFESSDLEPVVEEESKPLCAPLYLKEEKSLLFRVFYYKKRINVEIFHALSDGAGAVWFFETLIYHYMTSKHKIELPHDFPKLKYKASMSQKMDDSFEKTYYKKRASESIDKTPSVKAYQLRGTKEEENRTKLIEGTLSVKKVLELAHEYNTTLTVFMTALYFYAINKDMPSKMRKFPVVLQVPINLRQFFESNTARNFFGTMSIQYDFSTQSHELQDIINSVSESFKSELTREKINDHLDKLMSLEKNPFARVIPLPVKDIALKIANRIKDRQITSSISNVGRIVMPKEFEPYIVKFSVFVSARRPQIVLCSYLDNLVVSFTSPFQDTDLQRTYFQFLTDKGIEVGISSNL